MSHIHNISNSPAKQVLNQDVMATKVREDILFLRDRIERVKQLSTPNTAVLKTYESMLSARESVLAWLQSEAQETQTHEAKKFG